jgi:[ribosomal protein S18]-alanine N-acetyltransferase
MLRSSSRRSIKAVIIRLATPDDVPSIRSLEHQAEGAAHWLEHQYDALFATGTPRRIALVASDDVEAGVVRIDGFVIARCTPGEWELENVVVARAQQRLGIGTDLIRHLVLRARDQGATSVLLEVRESNLPARRLYEKLGFSEQGRRKDYYREPLEDALVLQTFIAAS